MVLNQTAALAPLRAETVASGCNPGTLSNVTNASRGKICVTCDTVGFYSFLYVPYRNCMHIKRDPTRNVAERTKLSALHTKQMVPTFSPECVEYNSTVTCMGNKTQQQQQQQQHISNQTTTPSKCHACSRPGSKSRRCRRKNEKKRKEIKPQLEERKRKKSVAY